MALQARLCLFLFLSLSRRVDSSGPNVVALQLCTLRVAGRGSARSGREADGRGSARYGRGLRLRLRVFARSAAGAGAPTAQRWPSGFVIRGAAAVLGRAAGSAAAGPAAEDEGTPGGGQGELAAPVCAKYASKQACRAAFMSSPASSRKRSSSASSPAELTETRTNNLLRDSTACGFSVM